MRVYIEHKSEFMKVGDLKVFDLFTVRSHSSVFIVVPKTSALSGKSVCNSDVAVLCLNDGSYDGFPSTARVGQYLGTLRMER